MNSGLTRQGVSSIGVETPVTLLADIRDIQSKALEAARETNRLLAEKEANDERRHKEMCTLLLGLLEQSKSSVHGGASTIHTSSILGHQSLEGAKTQFYYGSTAISTGTHLVGCILMHIDALLAEHPVFHKYQTSDVSFMDLKDWGTLVSYLLNADKASKGGLRLPKPTDEDFKSVCRVVAATAPGRRPRCDVSHIAALLAEAPGVMNTVEWVRLAIIKCKGVVSPEKELRFSQLTYPFVNEETDLSIKVAEHRRLPSKSLFRSVSDLKATQKKRYMSLILEGEKTPMTALDTVYSESRI